MEPLSLPWFEPEPVAEVVSLRTVFLHVTKACNLHCSYCYFSARKPLPDEMTTAEFSRLWPDLVAVGPEKVVFTGGEPLLREDILDLLRGLRDADPDHHVTRCLNTNGHRVTPLLARRLVGLADEVRVSLDAFPERNDALRGPGNFEAVLQALDCFCDVGFEPKVLITVTAVTLPDLEELLLFLARKQVTRVNVNLFREVGRAGGHNEWQVEPQAVRAALRRAWTRCYPKRPLPPEPPVSEAQSHCGVGQFLNVMPNGDVFPCHVLTAPEFRCGNVREQSLLEICHESGLIGQLSGTSFTEMARVDVRVTELTRPGACMGDIYTRTRSLPVWRRSLPLLQNSPKSGQAGASCAPSA